jgi:predicted ATPase
VSSFVGDNEYAFQNTLVRDVTYQGLTKARRTREHMRTGKWMEERAGGRSSITPTKSVYYMVKVLLAITVDLIKKTNRSNLIVSGL